MNKILILAIVLITACSKDQSSDEKDTAIKNEKHTVLEFIDGEKLGLDFKHDAGFSDMFSIYEPLGSGLAIIDYDNDNDMDIFMPQYGSNQGYSKLYNNNQMSFTDVTDKSGLSNLKDLIFASVADINNDGYSDLLVGGKNNLSLWINQGNGSFLKSDMIKTLSGEQFYTGASWFDVNRDGYLDLWVTNYVDDSIASDCKLANGDIDYCPPKSYQSLEDLMLINHNGKSFTQQKLNQEKNQISPGLGVVSDDFDNNGWLDIYVANDGVANQLYYNYNGVLSTDRAKSSGAAFNLMGVSEASMGIAVGDVDNNGYSDLYVTHFKMETNTLYLNDKGLFTDKTAQFRLIQHVRPVTGFGALLIDYNVDNLLDLITVNGSTQYNKSLNHSQRLEGEPAQFWKNSGSLNFIFEEFSTKPLKNRVGRGLVSSDLDNDGDFDFIISNNNQNTSIIKNNSNPNDWIGIIPICNNRIDYGAKLEFQTNQSNTKSLFRSIHSDGSYASSIDSRVLIYNSNQFDTLQIKWSESQSTIEYQMISFNKKSYNKLYCNH